MKTLVVVESPSKAKTINKYLGKDYTVLASFGHVRQLPKENGSVDVDNNFKIKYEISSQKHIKSLVDAMKECNSLVLASDPDREGEAIAWHVLEVLKQKKVIKKDTNIKRVVFNAITKNTVEKAMKEPRDIDMDLVNAQQARVALDYLVGFTLSPVLWRKLPGSRSAGRVQSVALKLICERQVEIINFKSEEYWTVDVNLFKNKDIIAKLIAIDGKKIDKLFIKNEKIANDIKKDLEKENYVVDKIEKKEVKRNPFAPFTTSTLQQEASKKLGFSAKKTMSVAQKLYEGVDVGDGTHGLITYMRTDGVYTAPEAINEARNFIKKEYGDKYLPAKAIIYQNKVKNAQEAHEAIRPTSPSMTPDGIKKYLTADEFKLYDLIWKRLIASQMASVIMDQVSIDIKTSKHLLRAVGTTIKFDGFYVLYNETNEEENDNEEKEAILPSVKEGEKLDFKKVLIKQHFTEPPARYTEASLVKKMEELGIGRPSTYATIISVLQDRGYVKLEKRRFIAENRGIVVNAFLNLYFAKYVEYDYTAKLENELDIVSNGKEEWTKLLSDFWSPFKLAVDKSLELKNADVIAKVSDVLDKFGITKNKKCPDCEDGILNLKAGKFGVFLACSNYPKCKHTEPIITSRQDDEDDDVEEKDSPKQKFENKLLGQKNKSNVYLKKGPYGFYIQLGEDKGTPKPKRVGVPKKMDVSTIDFEKANALLELPRLVGKHPDGGDIKANIGPYGPYLMWNKKFYSVKEDDILTITLNRALVIINKEK